MQRRHLPLLGAAWALGLGLVRRAGPGRTGRRHTPHRHGGQCHAAAQRRGYPLPLCRQGLHRRPVPGRQGVHPEAALAMAGPEAACSVVMLRDIDATESALFTKGMQDNMAREDFAKIIPARSRWPTSSTKKRMAPGEGFSVDYARRRHHGAGQRQARRRPGSPSRSSSTRCCASGWPLTCGRSAGDRAARHRASGAARPLVSQVSPMGGPEGSRVLEQRSARHRCGRRSRRRGGRHRFAVVVAVADQHHRQPAARAAFASLLESPDHQRVLGRRAQRLAGPQQRHRVGLLRGNASPPNATVKNSARPLAASSGIANAVGFVGQASELQARARAAPAGLDHSWGRPPSAGR